MSAQKLDLAPEFTSNNSLNIDHGLVCTESLLTDDRMIYEFTWIILVTMMTIAVITIMKMMKCRWLRQRKYQWMVWKILLHYVWRWTQRRDLQISFKNWCFIAEKMVDSSKTTDQWAIFQELNFLSAIFFCLYALNLCYYF